MTKEDYLIVCGDFGFVWYGNEAEANNIIDIGSRSFTTLFVDGNHENFDLLNNYDVEIWNGGKIHRISDSVIHLMRGQVFTINYKKFFTFGGAASHDISDGIIDPSKDRDWMRKAKRWYRLGKSFRIKGMSWWEEELPNKEEYAEAMYNLRCNDNEVDYIITHDGPASIYNELYHDTSDVTEIAEFLEKIRMNVKFKHWYFGHHHLERDFGNITCLYDNYREIV